MLADLLQKLNRMQEAKARPADFKVQFDAFVARADEYLDIIQPFFPSILVRFLPTHKESHASVEPWKMEGSEPDLTSEVA
jgi:hypothetical protein